MYSISGTNSINMEIKEKISQIYDFILNGGFNEKRKIHHRFGISIKLKEEDINKLEKKLNKENYELFMSQKNYNL